MIISQIIGIILLAMGVTIAAYAFINIVRFLLLFHARRCKYCGHYMSFKGYRKDEEKEYFNFHCEECGAWEKLERDELFDGK